MTHDGIYLALAFTAKPTKDARMFLRQSLIALIFADKKAKLEEVSLNSQVRESMAHLPSMVQPLLTWITGSAAKNQVRSTNTANYHLATSVLTLLSGWTLILTGNFVLTLLGMILVTGSMRKLQIVIVHHCSHTNFYSRKSKGNAILGNIISFSLFIEPFTSYRKSHNVDHHFGKHMTKDDPTVQFLFNRCKLAPGLSVNESKIRILKALLSPGFYIDGFLARLNEQRKMKMIGKLAMLLFWSILVGSSLKTNNLQLLILAWLAPLFILYPISSALRLSVEHTFPATQENRKFDLDSMSLLTNAVFCGEEYPQTPNLLNVFVWIARMLFIHLPVRVFVLVGDTPVHDHHHRHPIYRDWPNYAFARLSALDTENGQYKYREVWGYMNALEHSLKSLQSAKD